MPLVDMVFYLALYSFCALGFGWYFGKVLHRGENVK